MNETRTTSILERVPVIVAVTAASYGLPEEVRAQRSVRKEHPRHARARSFAARSLERRSGNAALQH